MKINIIQPFCIQSAIKRWPKWTYNMLAKKRVFANVIKIFLAILHLYGNCSPWRQYPVERGCICSVKQIPIPIAIYRYFQCIIFAGIFYAMTMALASPLFVVYKSFEISFCTTCNTWCHYVFSRLFFNFAFLFYFSANVFIHQQQHANTIVQNITLKVCYSKHYIYSLVIISLLLSHTAYTITTFSQFLW